VWLSDPAASAGVGDGFARAADGAMMFLGGDGQAEQQASGLGEGVEIFCPFDCFVPEELCQAIGLRFCIVSKIYFLIPGLVWEIRMVFLPLCWLPLRGEGMHA